MTTQPRMESKTEFSIWLRKQSEIDSRKGFNTCDIDYVWSDGTFYMIIEEKRYMSKMSAKQMELYKIIHESCKNDNMYKGFHLIQFSKSNPEDGIIYLDGNEISKNILLEWLEFRCKNYMYDTTILNNTNFIKDNNEFIKMSKKSNEMNDFIETSKKLNGPKPK